MVNSEKICIFAQIIIIMKITLPTHEGLEVGPLESIFVSCTKTYKFLWFQALLELLHEGQGQVTSFRSAQLLDVFFAKAWYAVLNDEFGLEDKDPLLVKMRLISEAIGLPATATEDEVRRTLAEYHLNSRLHSEALRRKVRGWMDYFLTNVPYRFLSPWIPYQSDKQVIADSAIFKNDCLYCLTENGAERLLVISNRRWVNYLIVNYEVLMDATSKALAEFVEKKIQILEKLRNTDPESVKKIERYRTRAQQLKHSNVELMRENQAQTAYIAELEAQVRRLEQQRAQNTTIVVMGEGSHFTGQVNDTSINYGSQIKKFYDGSKNIVVDKDKPIILKTTKK